MYGSCLYLYSFSKYVFTHFFLVLYVNEYVITRTSRVYFDK